MRSKKQPFTLLEISICLAILSLIGSLVSIKAKELIGNQQFKNAAEQLAIELREGQFLALNYQTDIQFEISAEKGKFYVERKSDEPVPLLSRPHKSPLTGIGSLFFDKKKIHTHKLTVYSTGRIAPAGELKLLAEQRQSSDEEGLHAIWLDLRTPLLIKLTTQPPQPQTESLPPYPSF